MADKRCFVQFPHPGDEHKPDGDGKIGWNKTHRNNRVNPHKRKFMQFPGKWIDEDGNTHCGSLRAWGEWEPESECIPEFDPKDGGPHHPNYLWKPYWVPTDNHRCLHNTDPFIFGDCFLYSNCGQKPGSMHGLKRLNQGSVIAFGSKVKGEQKWALDTVIVVRDSFPYDPLDPRKKLEGKVPDEFLEVTGGPLTEDPKLKNLAENREALEFRLYRGATPNDPVCGMYSFWLNSRIVCICDRLPGTSGGWIMDVKGFQVWLSAARGLTRAQRREALAVLSGRSEGEASKAAIELGVDEARRCPHCAREGAVSRGMARGLRRYQCKGCGRTFNALSGTPLSGLHHKERWLSFGASLAKGETVKASAARCDVAVSTAFRWRHRFLAAARSDSEVLKGIVEADETYVLESRKGARGLGRKARRRGGKAKKRGLSREQVPVLMAADRSGTTASAVLPRVDAAALAAALDPVVAKDALLVSDGGASYPPCAAALGVSHEALNRSMGERVRGDLHVQTVNSRHSRLKDFLRPRRGIATRYLDNYLSWFHLVGLAPGANDRACLAAAVTR